MALVVTAVSRSLGDCGSRNTCDQLGMQLQQYNIILEVDYSSNRLDLLVPLCTYVLVLWLQFININSSTRGKASSAA